MAEEVHVGRGGHRRGTSRWLMVVAVIAIVAVAIGAGVFARWFMERDNDSSDTAPTTLPAVLEEVQELSLEGKQAEADQKIAEALQDPSTPPDVKFTLYLQQGANYFQKGEYQKAIESYTKASEIRDTFELAQAIASTWQQLGDKQQAVTYLRKAIELMPQDNPVRDDDIAAIEEQIKALEAGQ